MNINRNFRSLFALIVIAILAALLSACSGDAARDVVKLTAQAAYNENIPASQQALQMSPRVDGCGISDNQLLLGEMKAEVDPNTASVPGLTIGRWLDSKSSKYTCIKAAE